MKDKDSMVMWLNNLKIDIEQRKYQGLRHYVEILDVIARYLESKERTGEWVTEKDSYEIICSKCKCEAFSEYGEWFKSDYCPNCGAKMKGEK